MRTDIEVSMFVRNSKNKLAEKNLFLTKIDERDVKKVFLRILAITLMKIVLFYFFHFNYREFFGKTSSSN